MQINSYVTLSGLYIKYVRVGKWRAESYRVFTMLATLSFISMAVL